MLRVTAAETATVQGWTLEGRLVGPWVERAEDKLEREAPAQNGRTCTVDLSAVTFIDKGGQRLLRVMSKEATQFIATSIYIKCELDQWKPGGKRGLLKVIYCFFGTLLGGVIAPLSRMQASWEPAFLAPSAKHTPAVVGTQANPLGGKER